MAKKSDKSPSSKGNDEFQNLADEFRSRFKLPIYGSNSYPHVPAKMVGEYMDPDEWTKIFSSPDGERNKHREAFNAICNVVIGGDAKASDKAAVTLATIISNVGKTVATANQYNEAITLLDKVETALDSSDSERQKDHLKSWIAGIRRILDFSHALMALGSMGSTSGQADQTGGQSQRAEFRIFYGPPGTGKTREARQLVGGRKENYKIVQIHPSSSYEDLIEGIKPVTFPNGDVKYEVQDGPVKIMAKKASNSWVKSIVSARYFEDSTASFMLLNFPIGTMAKWFFPSEKLSCRLVGEASEIVKEQAARSDTIKIDVTAENKDLWKRQGITFSPDKADEVFVQLEFKGVDWGNGNYVLVLDELNRGNVASILGELVFAISEARGTHADKKAVSLQYSHEQFVWPQSLNLYGTMNSTDVSLDRIDQAIKRRFEFKIVEPDPNVLKIDGVDNGLDKYLRDLNLALLNAGTESGAYNVKDKLIGHSYFLPLCESAKGKPQDEEFKRRIGTGLKRLWESQILQSLLSIFNGSSDELDKFVSEKLGQFAPNSDTKKIFGWPFDEAIEISGERKVG